MSKFRCKCGYLLSDNDSSVVIYELLDPNRIKEFDNETVKNVIAFLRLDDNKKKEWITNHYGSPSSTIQFDDYSVVYDLITVNRPVNEVWKCPNCGRLWIDNGNSMESYSKDV